MRFQGFKSFLIFSYQISLFEIAEGGSASAILQEVDLPIIDHNTCAQAYLEGVNQVDEDVHVCAGYSQGGKDACQGIMYFKHFFFL